MSDQPIEEPVADEAGELPPDPDAPAIGPDDMGGAAPADLVEGDTAEGAPPSS